MHKPFLKLIRHSGHTDFPELLPTDADGQIAQLTESTIGPYELHDFYLYHLVRHGARPARILDIAQVAFGSQYTLAEHQRWLTVFFRRFFNNQFKRSCTADGPKVGMVALSRAAIGECRRTLRCEAGSLTSSSTESLETHRDAADFDACASDSQGHPGDRSRGVDDAADRRGARRRRPFGGARA